MISKNDEQAGIFIMNNEWVVVLEGFIKFTVCICDLNYELCGLNYEMYSIHGLKTEPWLSFGNKVLGYLLSSQEWNSERAEISGLA